MMNEAPAYCNFELGYTAVYAESGVPFFEDDQAWYDEALGVAEDLEYMTFYRMIPLGLKLTIVEVEIDGDGGFSWTSAKPVNVWQSSEARCHGVG